LTAGTPAIRSALRRIRKMVSCKEGGGAILTSSVPGGMLRGYGQDPVYAGAQGVSCTRDRVKK